jgi:hypothetical protein
MEKVLSFYERNEKKKKKTKVLEFGLITQKECNNL